MTDRPTIYLDSNVFIYAVEGDEAISSPVQMLLKAARGLPGAAITSEVTLLEVLSPTKKGRKRLPHLKRRYLDLIVWSRFIDLQPISRAVIYETVALKATNVTAKLQFPDAIHLATAIRGGCSFFVSNDRDIPLPEGMMRILPDAASIGRVVEALR
ncbi:MAG: type II toxin-antitoxin system VapC family toxin [Methyloceanibacter sp.]